MEEKKEKRKCINKGGERKLTRKGKFNRESQEDLTGAIATP